MNPQAIIPYIGIPYEKGTMDCWQLIRKFAREQLNLHYPNFMYDIEHITEESAEHIKHETSLGRRWIKVIDPVIGDILIFRLRGLACHTGIYLGDGNFLHTLQGRESSFESLGSYWKQSLVGIYRWRPDE
jgi:cell wall-associated NlpC family hydrolase